MNQTENITLLAERIRDEFNTLRGIIPDTNVGYSIFPIWVEEGSSLLVNNAQWSYGNGAVGVMGITVKNLEVYAMSIQSLTEGTSVSIELMRNNLPTISQTFNGGNDIIDLATPISFNNGDILGFRTDTVTGTYTNVRVCAWCRIPLFGLKGDKGDAVECMRIPLIGQSDVNSTTNVILQLGTPNINTTTATVSSNVVNLPSGMYKVSLEVNVTSLAQRPNIGFSFYKDGVLYSTRYGGNYIRRTSGHDEAGDSITDLIEYASDGTFDVRAFQQGNTGTVDLLNSSRLLIEKIG